MEARNRPLERWFDRVRDGQLRLPRFQRFEAWSNNEVGALLETVLRELPAGATLILEVGDKEPFISRPIVGAPEPRERATEHLLDGQQRLTALWRSLHDNYDDRVYLVYFAADEDRGGSKIANVFSQARWWRNGKRFPLWVDDPAELHERGYLPLVLLRPGDIGEEIRTWCENATRGDLRASSDLRDRVGNLRQRVANYNIPFLSLPSTTAKDVALDVFIRMNTSSVRLTAFDIVVAQVEEVSGQSLHALVDEVISRAPTIEEYVAPSDLILNVAALRENHPPTQASVQRLDLNRLVSEWSNLADGIAWALNFLEEERIFDAKRLPTVAVLPVLAALHEFVPSALDTLGDARRLLRKYVWRAFLTRRYENAAATRALQDFRGLRDTIFGGAEVGVPIFDEAQYPVPTTEELKRAGWPGGRDVLARGILAVTLRAGALDIADGSAVSRLHLRKREYHHLFPDHLLTGQGDLASEDSYRALNCALITWNTNRNISAKEPLQYLSDRVRRSSLGEVEIRSRLASHVVPYDALNVGGYATIEDASVKRIRIRQDYEHFLDARAAALEGGIHALYQGQVWPSLST